jgi:hypothetical protein
MQLGEAKLEKVQSPKPALLPSELAGSELKVKL